jgi:hypothetical protein
MMTKQAKVALASELSRAWFGYTHSRDLQEKQASAAGFMQTIANSNASMLEKQAWAAALAKALPWAAKAGAGLLRGARAGGSLVGRPVASMGRGASLMGKGLSQGVTAGGNLSRSAAGGGGVGKALGGMLQGAGKGMQRLGGAGIAASKNAPSYAKSLGAMMPNVAKGQAALAGGAGRALNMGAGGAGLFAAGRMSSDVTPEQIQQAMNQSGIPHGGGWRSADGTRSSSY